MSQLWHETLQRWKWFLLSLFEQVSDLHLGYKLLDLSVGQ
jgi:hypothetical protein